MNNKVNSGEQLVNVLLKIIIVTENIDIRHAANNELNSLL